MRAAGDRAQGRRLRALIVILWRAGIGQEEELAALVAEAAGEVLAEPAKIGAFCA